MQIVRLPSLARATGLFALVIGGIACSGSDGGGPADANHDDTDSSADAGEIGADALRPDAPPVDVGLGSKCGFVSPDAGCNACLEAQCCDAARTCATTDACPADLRARRACTELTCAAPSKEAIAVDACLFAKCADVCGGGAKSAAHGYKGIGDPCTNPFNCLTGICSVMHTCTRRCTTDDDCVGYPDVDGRAVVHVCAPTLKGEKQCLPRCDTGADCSALVVSFPSGLSAKREPLRCADVGGSHTACALGRDKGSTPACYPNDSTLGGPFCSGSECLCGTTCAEHACEYPCSTNDDCVKVSDGLFSLCFHGSSGSHCGN